MTVYKLVYQVGIANVFRASKPDSEGASWHYDRVRQSDYHSCESFCAGLIEAGATVSVWHHDVAGDVSDPHESWSEGPGDLWREYKSPPIHALYATLE